MPLRPVSELGLFDVTDVATSEEDAAPAAPEAAEGRSETTKTEPQVRRKPARGNGEEPAKAKSRRTSDATRRKKDVTPRRSEKARADTGSDKSTEQRTSASKQHRKAAVKQAQSPRPDRERTKPSGSRDVKKQSAGGRAGGQRVRIYTSRQRSTQVSQRSSKPPIRDSSKRERTTVAQAGSKKARAESDGARRPGKRGGTTPDKPARQSPPNHARTRRARRTQQSKSKKEDTVDRQRTHSACDDHAGSSQQPSTAPQEFLAEQVEIALVTAAVCAGGLVLGRTVLRRKRKSRT